MFIEKLLEMLLLVHDFSITPPITRFRYYPKNAVHYQLGAAELPSKLA
jgi:hypothetical protein